MLHEAALETRRLHSDLIDPGPPMPTNRFAQVDIYLIAFSDGSPVGCGALRKLDDSTAEVRRMYVLRQAPPAGIGRDELPLVRVLTSTRVSEQYPDEQELVPTVLPE